MSTPVVLQGRGTLRDGRKRSWFYCDNAIFDLGISKYAKLIYLYLCRCAGDGDTCFPSFKKIREKTGCSNGVIGQALQELERARLIRRKPRRTVTGRQTSTIYTLLQIQPPDTSDVSRVQPVEMDRVQPVDTKKKHSDTEPREESQQLKKPRAAESPRPVAASECPEGSRGPTPLLGETSRRPSRAPAPDPNQERFDIFWRWVPKRISTGRGTKVEAFRVWNEESAPSPAEAHAITRLLRRYLDDPVVGYDFHDPEPLVRPADLVLYCQEAYRRRVALAKVVLEKLPELRPLALGTTAARCHRPGGTA